MAGTSNRKGIRRELPKAAPSWKVLHHDFNGGKVEFYDILSHGAFLDDIKQSRKDYPDDDVLFMDDVRTFLRYYFWSRCEHEILVSGMHPKKGEEPSKVDVFDQVDANWGAFCAYLTSAFPRKGRKNGGSVKKPLSVELVNSLLVSRFPQEAERTFAEYGLGAVISSKLEAFFVEYDISKKDGSHVDTVRFDFEEFYGFNDEDDLYKFWFEKFKRAWSFEAKAREAAGERKS